MPALTTTSRPRTSRLPGPPAVELLGAGSPPPALTRLAVGEAGARWGRLLRALLRLVGPLLLILVLLAVRNRSKAADRLPDMQDDHLRIRG